MDFDLAQWQIVVGSSLPENAALLALLIPQHRLSVLFMA